MAKMRNTVVNGGMTGRDRGINRVFAYRGGSYSQVKQFVKPSNPKSPLQTITREEFTRRSIGWSLLSEAERNAWDERAKYLKHTDQFGSKKVSGKAYYTGANITLTNAEMTAIVLPASENFEAEIGSIGVSKGALAINWAVEFDQASDLNGVQLLMSKPVSSGTMVQPKLGIVQNEQADANVEENVYTAYVAKYGIPVTGQKIYYATALISQGGNKVIIQESSLVW